MASYAGTKYFNETPVDVIKPNVMGTINLLEYARVHPMKKLLFLSSNSIYGEGGIDKCLLSENDYGIVDPLATRSCYIEAKKMAEQICVAYYKQFDIPTAIIRICHTYGPTFDIEGDSRIIPRVIKQIKNEEDIVIYKDDSSKVQYTYIADMCAAMIMILLKGENGQAYNAGGDELITVDDAIGYMVKAAGKKVNLIEKEIDSSYAFKKGNGVNFLMLDNSKLKALGWKILFSNEDGFARTVKKYLHC
jgi:nucleoside-diphosphate-sugar epimerase